MTIFRASFVLPIVITLAGCGGGSSSSEVGATQKSYAEYEVEFGELFGRYQSALSNDPATIPVEGSATYSGVMLIGTENGDFGVVGQMRMDVAFNSNTISGTVNNWIDEQDTRYVGSLAISDGTIDRSANLAEDEPTFTASLRGSIESPDVLIDVDGSLEGNFVGAGQRAVRGQLDLPGPLPLLGGFLAER